MRSHHSRNFLVGAGWLPAMAAITALIACSACSSSQTVTATEEGVVVGDFASNTGMLHATTASAQLELSCAIVTTRAPLIAASNGDFISDADWQRNGGVPTPQGEAPQPVVVIGSISGTRPRHIVLRVVSNAPGTVGQPITDSVSLTEGSTQRVLLCP